MTKDHAIQEKINLYANQMELIKKRILVIDKLLCGEYSSPYKATNIELCALQLRKVIELIMFSSLVANEHEYLDAYSKLGSVWKASLIKRDLERINSNFYPQPIAIIKKAGEPDKFENLDTNQYISSDRLISVYDNIGAIMHSENPFGKQIDYSQYENLVKESRDEIIKLLNCHLAMLSDKQTMLYVSMQSKENGNVSVVCFQRIGNA